MDEDKESLKRKHLDDLYEDYRYSISKFDSQALYITSGALGLSLAFVKDFVPVENAICLWLFKSAIWIFAIGIFIGFFAHYQSSRLIEKNIKLVDEGNLNQIKEDKSIEIFNRVIIGVLFLGISALVLFVTLNLGP